MVPLPKKNRWLLLLIIFLKILVLQKQTSLTPVIMGQFLNKLISILYSYFTTHYYSLEEVLQIAQNIDSCYMEKVNVATASLDFVHHKYSAIRVKYFANYEHVHLLQTCCIIAGVEFAEKVHVSHFAFVRVNKCFVLEELEEGIYIDNKEDHKGYITIPKHISNSEFSDILVDI